MDSRVSNTRRAVAQSQPPHQNAGKCRTKPKLSAIGRWRQYLGVCANVRPCEISRLIEDLEASKEIIDQQWVLAAVYVAARAMYFRRPRRGDDPRRSLDHEAFENFLGWSGLRRHLWKAPEYGKAVVRAERAAKRFGGLSADKAAQMLRLMAERRKRLDIRTIGAIDQTKEQRRVLRKWANKCRQAARRSRVARESERIIRPRTVSLSRTKPWQAQGISRRTWERRQKAECVSSVNAGKPWEAEGCSRATWYRRAASRRETKSDANACSTRSLKAPRYTLVAHQFASKESHGSRVPGGEGQPPPRSSLGRPLLGPSNAMAWGSWGQAVAVDRLASIGLVRVPLSVVWRFGVGRSVRAA
jgi:hypothetical protein